MGKFYAVVRGVTPGIYTDWPTAQKMVKGFPGAVYKGFTTRADAEAFMEAATAASRPHVFSDEPDPRHTLIYTDGSYKDDMCGFGVVMITSEGDKYTAWGKPPLTPTNNVAELYAIYIALSLVQGPVVIRTDSDYSISALTSYIHGWIKTGWAGIANRALIEAIHAQMKLREVLFEKVPAHSGVPLNEEVDRLADKGRLGPDHLLMTKNGVPFQN